MFGENAYNYNLFIKCAEGQNIYIFPDKDTMKKLSTQKINFYTGKNIEEIYEKCYCSNDFNLGGTFHVFSFSYSNLKNILFFKEDLGNYKLFKEPYLDIKRVAYFFGKNYKADLYYISYSLSLEGFFMEKNNLARSIFTGFQDKNLTFNHFPTAQKNSSIISQKLLDFIYSKKEEEILFYIPKSGYSYMYCPKCESINTCPKCNNYLTYFKDLSLVKCTKCGFSTDEISCIKCKSYCFPTGIGIEKVKETVENVLGLKLSKDRYNFIFSSSSSEFLTKRENVVLLFPDNLLSIPSYKARAYYYSTIFNGYACAKKDIFIESSYIDEYVYKSLINKNPYIFLENELSIRKEEELPPFKKFLLLLSDNKEIAFVSFSTLKEIGYKVFYPKLSYKNGKERFKVLLKIDSKEDIKNILSLIKEKKLRVRVYVDPPDLDF